MQFVEYGYQRHIMNKYFPSSKQCLISHDSSNNIKVISLTDLSAPFLILFIGIVMATISFAAEVCYYHASFWKEKAVTV